LTPALISAGFRIEHSEAGLYLWATRDEDCWNSVDWLASLGILTTPGIFYGEPGAKFIRIAMTASDKAISDAAARILASI
jgi:aspartate/methionine/tyrosine aminotransferase